VEYVIEGSVRRGSERVRITAQLIQVKDQSHLWAREYDRDLGNLLELQADIAREVANEIEFSLSGRRPIEAARKPAAPTPRANSSHYPPGASKWNPIEHRLFSEISKNWAGQPLSDMDTMLNFIRTTKTATGLVVSAYVIPDNYDTGVKISDQQMRQINLIKHDTLGLWNYSVRPNSNVN